MDAIKRSSTENVCRLCGDLSKVKLADRSSAKSSGVGAQEAVAAALPVPYGRANDWPFLVKEEDLEESYLPPVCERSSDPVSCALLRGSD